MTEPATVSLPRSPVQIDEALDLLARPGWLVLAGGTDVFPARVGRASDRPLLDLSRIEALRGVSRRVGSDGSEWLRVGALETWASLRNAGLAAGLEALPQAAAEVGGRQIQNQATIGGNLCNASPAADGVPVLLALGAEVQLQSCRGRRRLPLERFVSGNRRTALEADELLIAIDIPLGSSRARSQFLKLGHRRYLVISIAMVAVALDSDDAGRLTRCAIAVGACSAAACRLPALEAALLGSPRDRVERLAAGLLAGRGPDPMLAPLSPIDDVRGTAWYRLEAVRELIVRAIAIAAGPSDAASPADPGSR